MGVKRVCSFRRHLCSKHGESRSNQMASITMVTLPKLSNSYACISLKTGTLVIGSLVIGSLVIGSLNLVAFVIGIVASIGFMAAPTRNVCLMKPWIVLKGIISLILDTYTILKALINLRNMWQTTFEESPSLSKESVPLLERHDTLRYLFKLATTGVKVTATAARSAYSPSLTLSAASSAGCLPPSWWSGPSRLKWKWGRRLWGLPGSGSLQEGREGNAEGLKNLISPENIFAIDSWTLLTKLS